jgi:two-component system cell cycle sensor histidine kinase/response regulator CckA
MREYICLVVDDEPAIRAYLRAILQLERFQCLEANNAAQALRIVQKLDGRLDLVLTDIRMPGEMDGVDLAYSVQTLFPGVPVVLISGYADADGAQRISSKFEVIRKPFVPESILAAVKKAVESRDGDAYRSNA